MNDLISIVVPIYHVQKYLNRCVKSILKQTYSNLEIILVDDGSDDLCPKMCDEFAKGDSRIQVIHQKNGGLSAARNAGIDIARGKYIAFIDSDDCISEHYIEFLYRALEETQADIAQCAFEEFDDNSIPTFARNYTIPKIWNKMQALRSQVVPGTNIISTVAWNKLYRRFLFKDIRYTPGKLHEDEFTTYKIFDASIKVAYVDIALYGYFQNQTGIMRSSTNSAHIDGLEAKLERYMYYKSKDYQELLSLAATDFFDSLLTMARRMDKAVDYERYRKRLQFYLTRAKSVLCLSHLNRLDRVILHKANTPKQMIQYFNIYLFGGKISKLLQISKLKRTIAIKRMKWQYRKEVQSLFVDYIPSRTVFILGAIEYENLGDQAIVMAQKDFIHSCLPDYDIIEIREELFGHVRSELRSLIKRESILTIPGGGNMGDIWFDDEERRRDIIQDYPNNKIIVFPQTIDYSKIEKGEKSLEESIKLYNTHKNLVICAREQISFERMIKYYPKCKVVLTPDIVLSFQPKLCELRENVLVCLRNDKEKKTSPLLLDEIRDAANVANFQYRYTDTMASTRVFQKDRDSIVRDKLSEFASAKLVITDRLHGMIFAAITGTPCMVLPNGNHKVKGVYDMWLSECTFIQYREEVKAADIVQMYGSIEQLETEFRFEMSQFDQLKEVLVNG
ncbi:glycosyltransferase [Blautia sp.]|jgi:exopolysaccharide biosynthesis predicted pyruvyltransferase EpsI/GT2 family glycosyltransferase|uniref:glycosyltransferase n=1 Tax=Blautia sp. TaxID=1955243 RepID=UPI003D8B8C00